MSKRKSFAWQQEYRFAFASEKAFAFGNTRQEIVIGDKTPRKADHYPKRFIHLGNLRNICRVHTFAFAISALLESR